MLHITGEHDGRPEPPHSGSNIYPTYPPGRNESSVVLPDDEFIVPVNGRAEMRCIVKGEYSLETGGSRSNMTQWFPISRFQVLSVLSPFLCHSVITLYLSYTKARNNIGCTITLVTVCTDSRYHNSVPGIRITMILCFAEYL
jgi:hypothetical protein